MISPISNNPSDSTASLFPTHTFSHQDKIQDQIDRCKIWVVQHLTTLNFQVFYNQLAPQMMAEQLNRDCLDDLPRPQSVTEQEAIQLIILLGMIGSSIERHTQQQEVSQNRPQDSTFEERLIDVVPGQGLKLLKINCHIPFLDYFKAIADRVGHCHRDSVLSMMAYNGPAVEIKDPLRKQPGHRTARYFPDGAFVTFTYTQTEISFFALIKMTMGLQEGANRSLERLQRPEMVLASEESAEEALRAAILMQAVKAEIVQFMNHATFCTDHFLDSIRQYECPWYAEKSQRIPPPSVANDPGALWRDVVLFDEMVPAAGIFPGFRNHVRSRLNVLMPAQVSNINQALKTQTLQSKIMRALNLTQPAFDELNESQLLGLLNEHRWLAAYLPLYNAQRDISTAHIGLMEKFFVRPKMTRDQLNDIREQKTIVDNKFGTTGMDPIGIVREFNRCRVAHPLNRLNRFRAVRQKIDQLNRGFGLPTLSHRELLDLANFEWPLTRFAQEIGVDLPFDPYRAA